MRAVWLIGVVVAYLVAADPVLGVRAYQSLKRGAMSRSTAYRRAIAQEWGLSVLSVAALLGAGLPLARVGVRLGSYGRLSGLLGGVVVGLAIGGVVGIVITLLANSGRLRIARTRPRRVAGNFDALLPSNRSERRIFAVVAVTAGICEEFLYRGVVFFALRHTFPHLALAGAVMISALIFGLGHAYQGVVGVLATAVLGGALAVVYVATGSLLVPILTHILLDLRAVATARPATARGVGGDAVT